MDDIPLPQLLDFLQQAISCCRTNANYPHVPEFARMRLTEAADNIEFFMHQRELGRATREASLAITINSAVARYIQDAAIAVDTLREKIKYEA